MKASLLICVTILILVNAFCQVNKKVTSTDPVNEAAAIVSTYCDARKAMDAAQMEKCIADSFFLVSDNGSATLYNRSSAYPICEWEQLMNTKWTYTILGIDSNVVTVLLKEENDYYELLGLGAGVQVTEYTVKENKIEKGVSKLFITEKGTQSKAYRLFSAWLFSQPGLSEPDLVRSDGRMIFDGKSAPRMLYWLKKWNKGRPAD
jgi:hypothetical protein